MRTVALSDIAEIQSGAGFPLEYQGFADGDYPFAKVGDISEAKRREGSTISAANHYVSSEVAQKLGAPIFPENTIVFAKIGEAIRGNRKVITTRPMIFDNNVMGIIPNTERVLPQYLFRYLDCIDFYPLANSTTVPSIRKSDMASVEIRLPPMEEQKRIAAILDQADALRRKRQRALDRLNQLKQATFHEMFGDLLLSKQDSTALGDVCDVRDGTHDSPRYVETGYPLLTSKNFSGGHIDYSGASIISEADFIKINKRSKVDKGDIVMPMIGTIGSPVIVDFEPDFAIKNVALIKFKNSKMNSEFIRQVLDGPLFKSHVENKGRGGTQKFISLGDIRGFQIPLPSIEQQNLFSARMQALRIEKAKHYKAQSNSELLFSSLQYSAFKGGL